MIRLVEGWTERIRYALTADGAVQVLTGMTVALKLYTRAGAAVPLGGSAGVLDAAEGQVYYDPAGGELLATYSPYAARWEVTDGSGKKAFFPNGDAETWIVQKP